MKPLGASCAWFAANAWLWMTLGAAACNSSDGTAFSSVSTTGATGDAVTGSASGTGGGLGLSSGSGPSSGSGGAGGCGPAPLACSKDIDCDDGNPCTNDVCASKGEFKECTHTQIPNCMGDPTAPIDSNCDKGGVMQQVWVPFKPLKQPPLAKSCAAGFEWQRRFGKCATTYTVKAVDPCGAPARTLYVDIATYTAGDWLRIQGVGPDNKPYLLLDTCRIRTAEYADPTDGKTRPPDDSIRQYEIKVVPGTKSLTFDSSKTTTPWYMRVLGMCDYDVQPGPSECAWRAASL